MLGRWTRDLILSRIVRLSAMMLCSEDCGGENVNTSPSADGVLRRCIQMELGVDMLSRLRVLVASPGRHW